MKISIVIAQQTRENTAGIALIDIENLRNCIINTGEKVLGTSSFWKHIA